MWDWIGDNSSVLNLLVSAGMLVVWVVYLQLLLQSFHRERRPMILINRGGGGGLDGHCLLSNMSAEAIYVHSLAARLGRDGEEVFAAVTDLARTDDSQPRSIREATLQGPVASGDFVDIGTFRNIIQRAGWRTGISAEPPGSPVELELTVLATYRSEDLVVGARRLFDLSPGEAGWEIKPRSAATTQLRSKRDRRALLQAYLDYIS